MFTVDELSWLVGILGRGGSFIITKNSKNGSKYVQFSLGSTDLSVVQRVAKLLGTEATFAQVTPAGSDFWHVRLTGQKAFALALLIYNHVGEKKQQQISRVIEEATRQSG